MVVSVSSRLCTVHITNNGVGIKNGMLRFASPRSVFQKLSTSNTATHRYFSQSIPEKIEDIYRTVSCSKPVEICTDYLISTHSITGLPWWATIAISTIILRTATTFPILIHQNFNLAKFENVQLKMKTLEKVVGKEITAAVYKYRWSEHKARKEFAKVMMEHYRELIIKENCHPLKSIILIWLHIPIWIVMSVSLRNIIAILPTGREDVALVNSQFTTEGVAWFQNLLEIDPFYILPLIFGAVNLLNLEVNRIAKIRVETRNSKIITYLFRGLITVMVPLASQMPSCLTLYWCTSSSLALGQNLLLLSPKIRRLLRIPTCQSDRDRPFKHIFDTLVMRKKN